MHLLDKLHPPASPTVVRIARFVVGAGWTAQVARIPLYAGEEYNDAAARVRQLYPNLPYVFARFENP